MTGAPARPDVLICAGLDPSGGAGLIADVRVVAELGGRPSGVVTALTVQNTTAVLRSEPVSDEVVREQLEFLLSDVEVRAVKLGMIGSTQVARAIGAALALTGAPVVWDPVIQPSRGEVAFIDSEFDDALAALIPHVRLLTPNALELAFLAGAPIVDLAAAIEAGRALAARLATAVLIKGGHFAATDPEESIDVLCEPGDGGAGRGEGRGEGRIELLRGPRLVRGEHVHGTGCALSSAIATQLALGADLVSACRAAKAFVAARIAAPIHPGRGAAAIV